MARTAFTDVTSSPTKNVIITVTRAHFLIVSCTSYHTKALAGSYWQASRQLYLLQIGSPSAFTSHTAPLVITHVSWYTGRPILVVIASCHMDMQSQRGDIPLCRAVTATLRIESLLMA